MEVKRPLSSSGDDLFGAPLHIAARAGHSELVECIIARGADVNAVRVADGCTPLHLAAERGQFRALRVLLAASSCDVTAASAQDPTALFSAIRGGGVSSTSEEAASSATDERTLHLAFQFTQLAQSDTRRQDIRARAIVQMLLEHPIAGLLREMNKRNASQETILQVRALFFLLCCTHSWLRSPPPCGHLLLTLSHACISSSRSLALATFFRCPCGSSSTKALKCSRTSCGSSRRGTKSTRWARRQRCRRSCGASRHSERLRRSAKQQHEEGSVAQYF